MATNKLYAFAVKFLNNSAEQWTVHFKKNQVGINFMVHDFPPPEKKNVITIKIDAVNTQLTLIADHLSVYEMMDSTHPQLSEYHYTAYFANKDNLYQLHIYFNAQDDLTTAPQLSLKQVTSPHMCKIVDTQLLKDFAAEKIFSFMMPFRKLHNEQIAKDIEIYQTIEKELQELSADLEKNYHPYLKKINEVISFLNGMIPYHYDNYYQSVLDLFMQIKLCLQMQKRASVKVGKAKQPPIFFQEDLASHKLETLSAQIVEKKPKKTLLCLLNKAQERYLEFCRAKKNTAADKELVKLINESYECVQEVFGLSTDKNYQTNVNELNDLRCLMQKNQQARQKMLEGLLIGKNFTLAEELIGHTKDEGMLLPQFLAVKLIKLALHTADSLLLDFLLKHSHYPINTYEIANKLSPVMFCFTKNTPCKPMVDCLAVLIKHGASLMGIEPQSKLPVAHVILTNPQNPLRKALFDNKNFTVVNPQFYATLIHHLEKAVPPKNRLRNTLIKQFLEQYHQAKEQLSDKSAIHKHQIKNAVDVKERMINFLTQEELFMLTMDNDILEKKLQLIHLEQNYLDLLPMRQKISVRRESIHFLDKINELLRYRPIKTMEKLKEETLRELDNQIEVVCKAIGLHSLRQEIIKNNKLNSRGRMVRKLAGKQKELLEEIKTLGERYEPIHEVRKLSDKIGGGQQLNQKIIDHASKLYSHIDQFLCKELLIYQSIKSIKLAKQAPQADCAEIDKQLEVISKLIEFNKAQEEVLNQQQNGQLNKKMHKINQELASCLADIDKTDLQEIHAHILKTHSRMKEFSLINRMTQNTVGNFCDLAKSFFKIKEELPQVEENDGAERELSFHP